MKRVMEIYYVENKQANTKELYEQVVKRFAANREAVADELHHTGYFRIEDTSEEFQVFLNEMGIELNYNQEVLLLPLYPLTGESEESFQLFKKHLGHVGYDFEIRAHIQRNPYYLYFGVFDECI